MILRKYADLHLAGFNAENQIGVAEQLGYRLVGVVTSSPPREAGTQIDYGKRSMEVVKRVNLKPNSNSALLQMLRDLRRKYEIVAVTCNSTSVARQAAKDHRIDLLNFSPENMKLFDESEAELASNSNVALEINYAPLIKLEKWILPKVLRRLRVCLNIAFRHNIPVVSSSGAEDAYQQRPPMDIAAFMQLVGLGKEEALDSISRVPFAIIERNKLKLSRSYVAPGVRIIEGVNRDD